MTLGGRYLLLERLALGGMGEVWRAEDQVLGREVAVKVLREEHAHDPEFRRRFRAEAQHAAMLVHPNVAQVFDFGEGDDGSGEPPYLVMELVRGEPLSAIIYREAPLDAARTWSILGQAASALAAAHAVGVVHRDVKPANLLLCREGTLKVTDFGIARATGASAVTTGGDMLGTPHYVSPEQVSGEPVTASSDFYALGVVAFECLTGSRMYDGEPMAVLLAHREKSPPPLPAGVPAGLRDLVTALLDKDPVSRPTDGLAIAAQADRFTAPTVAMNVLAEPYPAAPAEPAVPETAVPETAASEPAASGPQTGVLPDPRPGRRRPHLGWPYLATAVAVTVAVGVVAAVVLIARHGGGVPAPKRAVTAPRPVALHVASVSAAAPAGNDADHPEEASLALDGNPATAWYTQHYASTTFGNLRSGAGLLFDLGQPTQLRTLLLRLAVTGVTVQIRAADSPEAAMSAAPIATATNAGPVWLLHPGHTARYWLVWFTRLAPSDGGYRAGVAEASFAR